jgi:hypothetical protein
VQRLTLYGPFVAIHLRFEDDILAWSGCQYDDSRKEQQKFKGEETTIAERFWEVQSFVLVRARMV